MPGEKRLYTQLMSAIGAPSLANERLHVLEERALRLLRRLEPKVIMIDEVHHLLSGSAREQRRSLNLLMFIANDLRVCVVAIGTGEARIAIQTDLQVASRFEPCQLPDGDRGGPLDPGAEQFVVGCRGNDRQRQHHPRSGGDRSRSWLASSAARARISVIRPVIPPLRIISPNSRSRSVGCSAGLVVELETSSLDDLDP